MVEMERPHIQVFDEERLLGKCLKKSTPTSFTSIYFSPNEFNFLQKQLVKI